MKVVRSVQEMQNFADQLRSEGKIIGFVPTMGFFHEGHLSLMRIARKKADVVVISIFVNPAQFGPGEDFNDYPRDFSRDKSLADKNGVDVIFYPSEEVIYPERFLTKVTVDKITKVLCGVSRPYHFQGVTTVCAKLFNIVKPHFAVFGKKDFQQSVVIKQMVKDLNFDLDIITGPIIRESDGLALSSRNTYLSEEERKDALSLNRALLKAEAMVHQGERKIEILCKFIANEISSKKNNRIDYISIVDPETLEPLDFIKDRALIAVAVFVGKTRLIDNILIEL
ncbi:MAG: pantoate--beta-alanine ligase [bacterium]